MIADIIAGYTILTALIVFAGMVLFSEVYEDGKYFDGYEWFMLLLLWPISLLIVGVRGVEIAISAFKKI